MTKRKDIDLCLLCKINPANKKNSHIIPKFLFKSIMGAGEKKRAVEIRPNDLHKKPKVIQDAPKEDHILCSDCEKFFAILETYTSNNLHRRIWDIRYEEQFEIVNVPGGIYYKVCHGLDVTIVRLFFYSIIWRCHVSKRELFSNFTLCNRGEEILRENLVKNLSLTNNELNIKIKNNYTKIDTFKFVVFIAKDIDDQTRNILFVNSIFKNPYFLILNDYIIIFSFDDNKVQQGFNFLNNKGSEEFKIGFIVKENWRKLIENIMINFINRAS